MRTIVFVDFDGTLTKKDTFLLFLKRSVNPFHFYFGLVILSPFFVLYFLKLMTAQSAKEKTYSFFFKGRTEQWLNEKAELFTNWLFENNQLNTELLSKIETYKASGSEISIVSASPNVYIEVVGRRLNIESIATHFKFENAIFTGKFETKNCNGSEKAKRIKEKYDLSKYHSIIALGNSKGDNEMLDLATEKVWVTR